MKMENKRAKREQIRWKEKVGTLETHSSKITPEVLIQDSPKAFPGELTLVKLDFFSLNLPKARPSEFTPVKLDFISSNSFKQVITHLGEMSLSPNPIRLNMRLKA